MAQTVVLLIALLASGTVASEQGAPPAQRGGPGPPPSRIYKLEELKAPQLDAFDRERTLFILPVAMLEVHGPHLPIGADIPGLTYEADAASKRLRPTLANWNIVMMPPISYGQSGANELGGRLVHPGTYGIRQSTLRSVVADLGGQVAQKRSPDAIPAPVIGVIQKALAEEAAFEASLDKRLRQRQQR